MVRLFQKFFYFFPDHTKIISCYFFKSGFEIRISCKRINEWLKQDLWLLRQSDSSLLANVLWVTKGGGNYLFSKQFFTFKYLTVKFVDNLCKWHSDSEFEFPSEITEENQDLFCQLKCHQYLYQIIFKFTVTF